MPAGRCSKHSRLLDELRDGRRKGVVQAARLLLRCHGALNGAAPRQGRGRRRPPPSSASAAAASLRSATQDLLTEVSELAMPSLPAACSDKEVITSLCQLLDIVGRLDSDYGLSPPPKLRGQLAQALLHKEDALGARDLAIAAEAVVAAFGQTATRDRRQDSPAALLSALARRAEVLGQRHQRWQPESGAASKDKKCQANTAAATNRMWIDELATVLWCFARLRTYSSRLCEDVLLAVLAPAAQAANRQAQTRGSMILPPPPLEIQETSLAKLCWAVGRLGPPIPDIHASLSVLVGATVPRAGDLATLAKVAWWSAVMGELDGQAREQQQRRCRAIAARFQALVQMRYEENEQRQQGLAPNAAATWNRAVGNIAWGLACQNYAASESETRHEFARTVELALRLGGVLGKNTHGENSRGTQLDEATQCRLHQYFTEFGIRGGSSDNLRSPHGGKRALIERCHRAFTAVNKKRSRAQQHKQRSPWQGCGGQETMQGRVGYLLQHVCASLGGDGDKATAWQVHQDVVLPSGYSVDFIVFDAAAATAVAIAAAAPVAIEVDGPSHFLHASTIPRGETSMKRRHLTWEGVRVAALPYWEWARLEGDTHAARVDYLHALLEQHQSGHR